MTDEVGGQERHAEHLTAMREEARFEIGLLHGRVNALIAAEAFLTIAYTTAMGNTTAWGPEFAAVVSPILAALGLVLALLAWPGTTATVKVVLIWTTRQRELVQRTPSLAGRVSGLAVHGRDSRHIDHDERYAMLFFRAVPGLFALVWAVLFVVALVIRH